MYIPFVFIISIARRDGMDGLCLNRLQALREIGTIVLMKEICPIGAPRNGAPECAPLHFSAYKEGLARLKDEHVPTGYLNRQSSLYAGFDDVYRTRWRARLVLDFVREMQHARDRVPRDQVFLHLENDVELVPELMPDLNLVNLPISCYYPHGAYRTPHAYGGSGALCFVFRNDESVDRAIQCALSRHLLQPLDWIIYDCFPNMKAYRASVHRGKISTRI
jgi:hypothetical protein